MPTRSQFGYGYDSRGNIDNQTFAHRPAVGNAPASPASDYGYDDLDRLTAVTYFDTTADTESFDYDILGNRKSVGLRDGSSDNYDVNSLTNRYNSIGGGSVGYDLAGNLTSDKDGYVYSWDHDNHLTAVKDSSLDLVAEYVYDALGRRVRKTEYINGGTATSQVQTDYYYNGWQLLTELVTDADLEVSTVNYAGACPDGFGSNALDEVLFYVTNDGTTETVSYLTHDHLNSPSACLNDSGTIQERFEYDAYGTRHIFNADYISEPTSSTLTVGFTGQRIDVLDNGNLTLCYYKNRWYLPEMGRFMSVDSHGMIPNGEVLLLGIYGEFDIYRQYYDGANIYQYTRSRPTIEFDSLGLQAAVSSVNIPAMIAAGFSAKAIADILGLTIEEVQKQISAKSSCKAKTGNCTWDQWRRLKDQVDNTCKFSDTRNCDEKGLKIDEIRERIRKNNRCAMSRRRIMNACYSGGDDVHQKTLDEARGARDNCVEKLMNKLEHNRLKNKYSNRGN